MAQMSNSVVAHTFLTCNFAPAHNFPPGDSTAVDAAAVVAVVVAVVVVVVVVVVGDDDHTALQGCNPNDTQVQLDTAEKNFGKLHGVSYQSQAHSLSQPFFFGNLSLQAPVCCLAASLRFFALLVVGDFSLESLAD